MLSKKNEISSAEYGLTRRGVQKQDYFHFEKLLINLIGAI
ncbi:hypothetical protein SAMN05428977_10687 [Nitrosomonas sp. Nm166]|nr:hypothetical protein SAMN05428977_10687 [Nitrosomonas sp. Nm166]